MGAEQQYEVDSERAQAERSQAPAHGQSPGPRHRGWVATIIALLALAVIVAAGIIPRLKARAALSTETYDLAVPSVAVIRPQRQAPQEEVVLPANIQPFTDAPIYARTNGYLKRWYIDIGAHVKAGQLLAEIDTPEVDQQLKQARADLQTAEANLRLAQITATRYADLLKTDSVAKQDADNAQGNYEARQAAVASAEANVKRLQDLQSFQKIYAPFDGVITARNVDVGSLIDAGSGGGPTRELFHIVAPRILRVYVNVPQKYSREAQPGLKAELVLPDYPGKHFDGKLVRTAGAIDANTRTLLTEVDVDNPKDELLTGAYAELHLLFPRDKGTFMLPVSALMFDSNGMHVATVRDGKHVVLKEVSLGRDYGNQVEVLSGLDDSDQVVVNPPDSLTNGETVRVAPASGGPGE